MIHLDLSINLLPVHFRFFETCISFFEKKSLKKLFKNLRCQNGSFITTVPYFLLCFLLKLKDERKKKCLNFLLRWFSSVFNLLTIMYLLNPFIFISRCKGDDLTVMSHSSHVQCGHNSNFN